jgi:hypothetical protein
VGAGARDGICDASYVGAGEGDAVGKGLGLLFAPGLVGVAFAGAFVGLGCGVGVGLVVGLGVAVRLGAANLVPEDAGLALPTGTGVATGPASDAIGLPAESTSPKIRPS